MPDIIKISELDEALALADAAEFPFYQDNGGQNTTYKAPMTQIGAKIVEGLTYQGINLPAGAGNKTVENSLNYLLNSVGGDPNGNISDSYDPTANYVKGDLCIYENVLYICTATTTGTFDPSKWTATTIDNVIGDLTQLTTTEKSSLVGAVNEVVAGKADKAYTTIISSSNGITFLKFGKMYVANFNNAQINNIVSALNNYLPQKTASAMIWDYTATVLCNIRLSFGTIVFINASNWTYIANTSTDIVHGQIVFFED